MIQILCVFVKEEVRTLTSKFEGSKMKSSEAAPVVANDKKEENDSSTNNRAEDEPKKQIGDSMQKFNKAEATREEDGDTTKAAAAADQDNKVDKAAKRQRLKSGFRVCKPQGTFIWPNNNNNTNTTNSNSNSGGANGSTITTTPNGKVVVHMEDLFLVPTPPSTSSSSSSAHPLPFPPPPPPPLSPLSPPPSSSQPIDRRRAASPVKPLAERRAVNVTVSTTVSTTLPANFMTVGEKKKALLNLNEAPPPATSTGFFGAPSSHPPYLSLTTTSPRLPRVRFFLALLLLFFIFVLIFSAFLIMK